MRNVADSTSTSVLLIEDEPDDARLIQEALGDLPDSKFRVEWVDRLGDAVERLNAGVFDVILLDLTLPDSQGFHAFDQVFAAAPEALILVLSTEGDEELARQAVQRGAQDYLAKVYINAHWLPRAINYVIERSAIRDSLRLSEARFRAISDAAPLGIFVSDADGACEYTNAAYQKISGLTLEESLGMNWSMAIHPDDRTRVLAEWRIAARSPAPFQAEYRFLPGDDRVVWTRINSAAIRDGKAFVGAIQTVEDISERKAAELELLVAESALFEEKERAQVTLDSIGDAVLTTDLQGRVTYLNPAAMTMTGWPSEQAIGSPLDDVFRIIDGNSRQTTGNPAKIAIAENRTIGLADNCMLVRRDGLELAINDSAAPIHDRDGAVVGAVLVFEDVSESRAMTLKMSHLARHDFLTGLPNRMLLTERLSQAIGQAHRHHRQVVLFFLDLDYFKNINDSLGHAIGDQLLQSVGERLMATVRTTDTVCRQGGDEFVILLPEIEHPQDAALIAQKLLDAFALPHHVGGQELHITLSIGISIYPDDGLELDSVMQSADTAMYHAKKSGRNNFQFFRADMNTLAVRRLLIESNMRRTLRMGEFMLNYQPQINLLTGKITSAEALIRWDDPELGSLSPMQFVPVAEECGLIVPIGRWVLGEACRQVKAWLDAGLPAVPISVNISAVEFRHKNFLQGVSQILAETGLSPDYLELELTESVLMHDVESSAAVLESLKTMGIRLAIDDFGTGYSSLAYLKRFPITSLKIDQSFVREITTDSNDATIVTAVVGMGRNLNHRVVAEGVETREQFELLEARQCPEGQGFLFSYPLPAEDFAKLLVAGEVELPRLAA